MIHVTRHACERYIERIDPTLTLAQAKAEIETHSEAIVRAAAFGCGCVLVSRSCRLMLDGAIVTTIKNDHPTKGGIAYKTIRRGMRKAEKRHA